MDYPALEKDLEAALSLMPPKLMMEWIAPTLENLPLIKVAVPKMIPLMKPHVMALMMEAATEILDKKALEESVMKVLAKLLGPMAAQIANATKG